MAICNSSLLLQKVELSFYIKGQTGVYADSHGDLGVDADNASFPIKVGSKLDVVFQSVTDDCFLQVRLVAL